MRSLLPERLVAAVAATRSLLEALDLVLAEARRLTDAEAAAIFLRDGGALVRRIAHNELLERRLGPAAARATLTACPVGSDDIPHWVLRTGRAVNVPDAYRLAPDLGLRFDRAADARLRYRTRSLLAVPVFVDGAPAGVLELVNARDTRGDVCAFAAWHETVAEAVAALATEILERPAAAATADAGCDHEPAPPTRSQRKAEAMSPGEPVPARRHVGRRLGELLVAHGLVTLPDLEAALAEQRVTREKLGVILVRRALITEEQLTLFLSLQFKVPAIALDNVTVPPEVLALVPVEVARKHDLVPIERFEDTLMVVSADPNNGAAIEEVGFVTGLEVIPSIATRSAVRAAMARWYAPAGADATLADDDLDRLEIVEGVDVQGPVDLIELRTSADDAPVVRLVNGLIRDAIRRRASDIHLEPFDTTFRVRFRVDGLLRPVMTRPRRLEPPIVSRIKIMANLDIAERRRPQDGHVKIRYEGRDIDLRIAILPTHFGEAVNLRILDRKCLDLDPAALGFAPADAACLGQALALAHGLILITGPTGSGKTTTLYSAVTRLNTGAAKILTVEDPIEYGFDGVNQVEVNDAVGRGFATTLRAFLRHDPDVVMVGEMRDLETAQIAVRGALTGHLVLSTLHTNDAASTVVRLVDMGIAPYLVAESLRLVVAQRLLRRLCPHCREPYELDEADLVSAGWPLGAPAGRIAYRPRGCAACDGTGMSGRLGIYQLMPVTDELRALIVEQPRARDIEKVACEQGMRTLRQAGLARVLDGSTTLDEVRRVTAEATLHP